MYGVIEPDRRTPVSPEKHRFLVQSISKRWRQTGASYIVEHGTLAIDMRTVDHEKLKTLEPLPSERMSVMRQHAQATLPAML